MKKVLLVAMSLLMEVAGTPLTYWMDDVEFLETQDGTRVTSASQEEPSR